MKIQGPNAGEYRGLTIAEQQRMNEMYRELNDWNARAFAISTARETGECSCGWFFSPDGDPYCSVHS